MTREEAIAYLSTHPATIVTCSQAPPSTATAEAEAAEKKAEVLKKEAASADSVRERQGKVNEASLLTRTADLARERALSLQRMLWKVSLGTHDGFGPDLETAVAKARDAAIKTHLDHAKKYE